MNNPKLIPWLEAGIRRFAAMGPDGLNINEISAEIKISKTSFYHFFGSKQEYINQLFEHWLQEGTINIIKDAFLKDNAKSTINTLFRKVIFDNYHREKFLSQLINSQNSIPISKKFLEESRKFRQSTLEGLCARLGLSADTGRKRSINLQVYSMGLTQYYFHEEPSISEKEEIFSDLMETFFPEVLDQNK